MNQKQREFLLKQVENTWKEQIKALHKPLPPSLNNYITAAILDGTFKLRPEEKIREDIRNRVLKLSSKESFLSSSRRNWDDEDEKDGEIIELRAKDFFELPPGYVDALEKYSVAKLEYDKNRNDLNAKKDTITLKIQIGSDKVLDRLIEEVDNLSDLSLMNSFLVIGPVKQKAIGG